MYEEKDHKIQNTMSMYYHDYEQSRGFGVIAEEIRKLASGSAESIKQVENIISEIKEASARSYQQTTQTEVLMAQVTDTIMQIANSIQLVHTMAEKLDQTANNLVNSQ